MPKRDINGNWVNTKADDARVKAYEKGRRGWRKYAMDPADRVKPPAGSDAAKERKK